jgi:hypothetical protein
LLELTKNHNPGSLRIAFVLSKDPRYCRLDARQWAIPILIVVQIKQSLFNLGPIKVLYVIGGLPFDELRIRDSTFEGVHKTVADYCPPQATLTRQGNALADFSPPQKTIGKLAHLLLGQHKSRRRPHPPNRASWVIQHPG